jgi:TonB family protein
VKILRCILILLLFVYACKSKSKQIEDSSFINDEIGKDTLVQDVGIIDSGKMTDQELVYMIPEELPQYGNGFEDIKAYILKKINYPESAISDSIEGRVVIKFIINKNGTVSNPEILRSVQTDIDNECIRVVENMAGWIPGKQMGKAVKSYFIMPISFYLKAENIGKGVNIIPKEIAKSELSFKIYPNPATDYFRIEISGKDKKFYFQVIDTKGIVIKKGKIFSHDETIDVSDLNNGLYIIRLFSEDFKFDVTEKLIKR